MTKILIEQKTKPGSKAAMRMALESVADYITVQQSYRVANHGWWPMLKDTVREVNYALGRADE